MHLSLFLLIIGICLIISGRFLFGQWVNPFSFYFIPWIVVMSMYHLKLMAYDDLVSEAWAVIIIGHLSFILGSLLVFPLIQKSKPPLLERQNVILLGFTDNQLKFMIGLFGSLGLFGAIQHWMVLIKIFGNLQDVMLAANIVYAMRVEGGLTEVLPYISFFSYAGVLLVGVRIAFRGKVGLIDAIPILALVFKEVANFTRAGLLAGFSELFIGFVICRMIVKYQDIKITHKGNARNIVIGVLFLGILLIGSSTAVRFFRGTTENYKQSSRELGAMRSNIVLTPSLYLYASGHVGTLSKYLYLNNEKALFGENTFLPVYHVLAKFNIYNKTGWYQKPYFIPVWINTGTYLREVHADFGPIGVLIVPFLLGFFSTYYWFKVKITASPYHFAILSALLTICIMSFLVMFTRDANFLLTYILLIISFAAIQNLPKALKQIKNRRSTVAVSK